MVATPPKRLSSLPRPRVFRRRSKNVEIGIDPVFMGLLLPYEADVVLRLREESERPLADLEWNIADQYATVADFARRSLLDAKGQPSTSR